MRMIRDLIAEINLNAMRGFYGPGSFRCRHTHSLVTGPCITQLPSVKWGPDPNQIIHLRKLFTCAANNVVYLLYCKACLKKGLWTTYVGESENKDTNLHQRFATHCSQLCTQANNIRYPSSILTSFIIDMLNGAQDPYMLLQDIYAHFQFVHTPQDRRYLIFEGGFPTTLNRKHCETMYKYFCGNFQYFPATMSGSLNKTVGLNMY